MADFLIRYFPKAGDLKARQNIVASFKGVLVFLYHEWSAKQN